MRHAVGLGTWVVAALGLVLVVGAGTPREVEAATTLYVTSTADSGPGSLRDAVGQANTNSSVNLIVLKNTTPITLTSYVEYSGSQSLTVRGDNLLSNRAIQGASTCGLFLSSGGADITFQRVTFQDSDCSGLEVPLDDGDGEVVVTLDRVVIQRMGSYGVVASEGGARDASLRVKLSGSVIQDTGSDGLYLYEDGAGALTMEFAWSSVARAGGAGVFAASYEDGDLVVTASNSSFSDNGGDGLTFWTKSGADARITLQAVRADRNGDHGVFIEDFDGGSVELRATGSTMSDNGDTGLELLEHDDGGVRLTLLLSRAERNGGRGVVAAEQGSGDFGFLVSGSTASRNGCCSPAGAGFELTETGDGDLLGALSAAGAIDNEGNGFVLGEEDGGQFDVTMYLTVALANGESGTRATAGGDAGVIRALASNAGPFSLTNVNVVP